MAGTNGTQHTSEDDSGISTERPGRLVSSLGLRRRLIRHTINSRPIRPIARPQSPPPRGSSGRLLPNSTNRRTGGNSPPRRPGRCPHRGNDHDSSFANNRTLADIYLDARHLLSIFSSCFLHVSSSSFLHVFRVRYTGTEHFASARAAVGRLLGPCRWPAGVGSAGAADGQMFDAVDPAEARRPGATCLVICPPR